MTITRRSALRLGLVALPAGLVLGTEKKARAKRKSRKVDPAVALEKVNDAADTSNLLPGAEGVRVLRAQILLDRARFSPGEIDGRFGPDMEIAVEGYRERHELSPGKGLDVAMWELLNQDAEDLLTTYTVTAEDLKEPLVKIPKDVKEQEKMRRLGYETAAERMAEKFHLSTKMLGDLNPKTTFETPGEEILVPNLYREPGGRAARVVVSKSKRTVTALATNGKVIAQYPATIGGPNDPLPIGNWKVTVVQPYPAFYYNTERFWNRKEDKIQAKLPPGPNNPAGTVWIGLSKPHYGIHGAAEPGNVRRSESYGCIRLTNWDASDLSKMVRAGTPAILEE